MWDRKFLLLLFRSVFWTQAIVYAEPDDFSTFPVVIVGEPNTDPRQQGWFPAMDAEKPIDNSYLPSTEVVDLSIHHRQSKELPYRLCVPAEAVKMQFTEEHFDALKHNIISSIPKLDNKTQNNRVVLSLFFDVDINNLEALSYFVKASTEKFLREFKTIRYTVTKLTTQQYNEGDFPDLLAQVARMSSGWEDNIASLKRWKREWEFYMQATVDDLCDPDEELSKKELALTAKSINRVANTKVQSIKETLEKFSAAFNKVEYLNGKTTDLSSFANNVISYIKEMFENEYLHREPVTTTTSKSIFSKFSFSSKNTGVSRSRDVVLRNQLRVPKDLPCSQILSDRYNYEQEISKVYSEFNALPVDGLIKHRLFGIHIFFLYGLESITRFGFVFNKTINHFLNELKSTHSYVLTVNDPDSADVQAQVNFESITRFGFASNKTINHFPNELKSTDSYVLTVNDPDFADVQAQVNKLAETWKDIVYSDQPSSLVMAKSKWDRFLGSNDRLTEQKLKEYTENFIEEIHSVLDRFLTETTDISEIAKSIVKYSGTILKGIQA